MTSAPTTGSPVTDVVSLIWRIGDPGLGPDQFAADPEGADRDGSGRDGSGPAGWRYVVGASDPARDWPARLSGPMDAEGGWREHTATIEFTHTDPDQPCRLRIGVQSERGPCPELRVTVNRTSGLFYPESVLSDRSRLGSLALAGGEGVLEIDLPAGLLVAGRNEISLTATAADDTFAVERRRHREQFGYLFGSQLGWFFVELLAVERPASREQVMVRPLPLYEHWAEGLHELIDIYLVSDEQPRVVALHLAGGRYDLSAGLTGRSFGQERLRVAVPEFTEPSVAAVEIADGAGRRTSEQVVTPCRKWTLHLIPHVHLDLGYTDYQGKVIELHSRNLDRALEILRDTPDYKFMIDGSMILDAYLRSRTPQAAAQVLDAVRAGTLTINAYYALFLTGLASLEECCRATYLSAQLAEDHDLPVTYANLTDVPSYTHAMPSLLRAAGIEAFLGIQNHTRGGNEDSDIANHNSPYIWEGPDGATVLTFFADTYNQLRFLAADPPMAAGLAATLPRYLSFYDRPDYLPADLPIVGIHTDNEDLADGEAGFVDAWNARYAFPRLRWSTPADYFSTVEPLADRLPRWKGDGGSYWEDGAGTAAAIVATYRAAQNLLPVAESLQALVALDTETSAARNELDAAWAHLLIGCEHTWTSTHASAHPHSQQAVDQLAWKRHQIESAARIATDEIRRGLSQLADRTSLRTRSLVVYNGSSWARSGEVTVELPREQTVTDEAGVELPAERQPVDGFDRLRLTVPEVPAFGYRVIPIRPRPTPVAVQERALPERLTTDRWEVEFDSAGRIEGLRHRGSGSRLIDPDRNRHGWALGELLYVTGGGDEVDRGLDPQTRTSLYDSKIPLPPPDLSIVRARLAPGALVRTQRGWLIQAEGSAPSLPFVRSEIRLYDDSDRIDVEISLRKEDVLAKESVYVAFPFAVTDPVVRFDRHLGWVDPVVDHTPGACNEWFTASNVVAVTGAEGTILWSSPDSPLFAVGDVVRGRWPTEFQPDSTLLSWAMNNYWFTNTPASQSGDVTLRYSFEHQPAWDPVAAARFGRDVRSPLVVGELAPNDKFQLDRGSLRESAGSLWPLRLPPNVAGTIHQARRGPALILRIQELAGRDTQVQLVPPVEVCTSDERRATPVAVEPDGTVVVTVPANGMTTLRLPQGS